MKNKSKILAMGLICGMLMATTSVSAQTRDFVFHMDTSYAHG